MADGNTGKVAIMLGGSRDAFQNPTSNLSKIHFHSDLDYLTVVQQIYTGQVTFGAITGQYYTVHTGKKNSKKDDSIVLVPQPTSGTNYYHIGTLAGDPTGPTLGFANGQPLSSMLLFSNNYQSYNSGWSAFRNVSLMQQGSELYIVEQWYSLGADIPTQALYNIQIVKFNLMSDQNPNSPYKLYITPQRFIASGGKLDSATRYVKRSPYGPWFVFPTRTMDCSNGGGRWARVDGSYYDENGYDGTWTVEAPPVGITM